MRGLLVAIRLSTAESVRGLKKWADLFNPFSNGFPPGLAVAGVSPPPLSFPDPTTLPQPDKKTEGILWGVPKRRRSVERRTIRKFGLKEWVWKMLVPQYNILTCEHCGHHYKAKHLCRNCYDKAMEETKAIRESVEAKFGDSPIDKNVIILYESDKTKGSAGTEPTTQNFANNLIVEFPKERPTFFSHNLLQKSTTGINRKQKDVTVTDPVPTVHKPE